MGERLGRWIGLALVLLTAVLTPSPAAANAPERLFHLPAGPAVETLQVFASQSGEQIIFLVDTVRGEHTRAVRGQMTPPQALAAMLAGTELQLRRDAESGALTVVRRALPAPAPDVSRQTDAPAPSAARTTPADEVVELSAFTVSAYSVDRYRAETAISAVRVRASLLETPSSVSVLTRDVLDDVSPTRLFDATRYLAGIEDGRGIQFQDRQIIRGFESSGRTVDNFLQIGADNYDEAVVERIEVSKGPNAILAPAGVPGGSINVITKAPSFAREHALTTLVGRFDAQKITLDLTGPFRRHPDVAYRFIAAAQDSRRYWSNDARLRNALVAPMLTWKLGPASQLTLKVIATRHWVFREPAYILHPDVDAQTGRPNLAPGFSSKGLNGMQPWSHVGTRTADLYALFTSDLSEHVSLRVAGNLRRYREDSMQEFLRTPSLMNRYHPETGELTQNHTWAVDPVTREYSSQFDPLFDPTAVPVRGDLQDTTHSFGTLQTDVVVARSTSPITSQTVAGAAFTRSVQESRGWSGDLPSINLLAPAAPATPIWEAEPYYDNDIGITNWQAYVNQRFSVWRNRVNLTAGFTHYDIHNRTHNRALMPEASVIDGSRELWMGSVLAKPRENLAVYYVHSTNSTPAIVNEAPLWRDGQQHEIGVKSEWFDRRLSVNAAWFDITQTNVSVPNPERQTDMNAPEQLIADFGNHGFELEVMGALTRNLSIIAAHTELRLRDRLGRPVRGVADHNSAVLLNYRFREGRWANLALHLGITHAGKRPGDTTPVNFTPLGVPTRPSFFIPAYTLINAGAAYPWRQLTFRLNVDNVLDDAGYLQQAGGRVSGTGLSTAPGINLKFTARWEF